MSILTVGSGYPPGYGGNPYNGDDISKFFDLNWPDHAGILGQGYTAPGLGQVDLSSALSFSDPGSDVYIPDSIDSDLPTSIAVSSSLPNLNTFSTGTTVDLSSAFPQGAATAPNTVTLTPTQQAQLTSQLTPAQQAQLISAIGSSAVSLVRTAEGGPYTVAGTNLVYNPATGALTTSGSAAGVSAIAGLTPYIPYIALAIAAIVILPMLTGKK